MGVPCRCPECGDNFGKTVENPRRMMCECGAEWINEDGYDEEEVKREAKAQDKMIQDVLNRIADATKISPLKSSPNTFMVTKTVGFQVQMDQGGVSLKPIIHGNCEMRSFGNLLFWGRDIADVYDKLTRISKSQWATAVDYLRQATGKSTKELLQDFGDKFGLAVQHLGGKNKPKFTVRAVFVFEDVEEDEEDDDAD